VIVEFIDNVTGTAVYINPAYVVSLRPDPAGPADVTLVKLEDGETIRVRGNPQRRPGQTHQQAIIGADTSGGKTKQQSIRAR
jgi:hypothetical protein